MEPVLSIRDLQVSFATPAGTVQAVRGVSLDVQPGELVGIVGESGSGKSVSFLSIMGLLPGSASVTGSAKVAGTEMIGVPDSQVRAQRGKKIAMIFQDPLSALNPVHRIGALGARWGLSAEESFRSALAGILTESYGVTVLNISFQDSEGKVFGRPDQVEMDIVVTNGVCMAIEIKSSVDKQAIYLFDRKVQVYSEREGRTVNRKIVISPMVDSRAFRVAKELGIEVFTRSDDEALFRRTEQTS